MRQFKFFQSEQTIRWRTANGLTHPIHTISIDHIVSIIRCINGEGEMIIPNPYEGKSHAEWIGIFYNELRRRNQMPNSVVES